MTWTCPACDSESEKVYRCSECGKDMAGDEESTGRGQQ